MRDWKWVLFALLVLGMALLLLANGMDVSAQGAWVHGIVQDIDTYEAVPGGTIRVEHEIPGGWEIERISIEMQGHAFGWDLTKSGWYAVYWEKPGWETVWIRSGEFTLATAPTGDIMVNVRRVTAPTPTPIVPTITPTITPIAPLATPTPWPTLPVPTTLYPPTVNPTATATPTPTAAPCLEFQQFTQEERRSVIATALLLIGHPLEDAPDIDNDPTLLYGLRDMLLGAPVTRRFEVMGLTARGFCQAIVVMRPVAREECYDYGIIDYGSGQNYEPQ